MCLRITDKDCAVQKILSDHGVLSLLFLTTESQETVLRNQTYICLRMPLPQEGLQPLSGPRSSTGLLAARAEVVELMCSVQ